LKAKSIRALRCALDITIVLQSFSAIARNINSCKFWDFL